MVPYFVFGRHAFRHMDHEREAYIQKNLDDIFRLWLTRAALWGCVLFLTLGALDYFVTPENFSTFLRYRIMISLLLLLSSVLTQWLPQRYLFALSLFMVGASALSIEVMILRFGGHASPYYAGIILLGISVIGFIAARFRFHVSVAVLIYLTYFLPIVMTDNVSGHRDFLIANAFIILIFSTMLLMRYLSGRSLVEELGLKYDLDRHRARLEEDVATRTADLAGAIESLKQEIAERKKAEEERQRLQVQLMQAQKMESIGRLAGGVAHDFNNILTAILSYAELSLMKLSDDHPVRNHLIAVQNASEKAAALTHQLLAFSRRQILEMKVLDLNAVIQGMADMLRRLIGEDMLLELRPGAATSMVRADRGQIEQILMNLAVNARDAMPSGGRLVIKTDEAGPDDHWIPGYGAMAPGAYVKLSVTDTGTGMTEDVRERIFEPFFTTKELGRGTGLGLATVYGIVKQHSGFIVVDSMPGRGTTFRIYFRLVEGPETDRKLDQEIAGDLPLGTETLLVAEDDPSVRGLVGEVLVPLGYRVLPASSGADAVATSDSFPDRIDLLLTDVVMPGMNGRQLAEVLRSKRPGIKALFMSGYAHDALSTQGILEPGVAMILKPLRPATLARQVRQVLDSGA